MPHGDAQIARRGRAGFARNEPGVDADFKNGEQLVVKRIEPRFFDIGVCVMGSETKHHAGVRAILNKGSQSVSGQGDRVIGDMVEVHEVRPEVFEREEIVGRDREEFSRADAERAVEFVLDP